jgi:hypothetical protein
LLRRDLHHPPLLSRAVGAEADEVAVDRVLETMGHDLLGWLQATMIAPRRRLSKRVDSGSAASESPRGQPPKPLDTAGTVLILFFIRSLRRAASAAVSDTDADSEGSSPWLQDWA